MQRLHAQALGVLTIHTIVDVAKVNVCLNLFSVPQKESDAPVYSVYSFAARSIFRECNSLEFHLLKSCASPRRV